MAKFGDAFTTHEELGPIFFAGRTQELALLEKALVQGNVRVAVLTGVPGIGKTTLAKQFAAKNSGFFSGGAVQIRLPPLDAYYLYLTLGVTDVLNLVRHDTEKPSGRKLFLLDDAEAYPDTELSNITASIERLYPESRTLITSRRPIPIFDLQSRLAGLSKSEMMSVWASNLVASAVDLDRLYSLVGGNPLAGTLAGRLVRDGIYSVSDFDEYFHDFKQPGIVGPDGQPLRHHSNEERTLVSNLVLASERVLQHLDAHPEKIHELSPRQFEEFVAELLARQGFEVLLTPASKDGGKDIYVARQDSLGSCLFLVECKKYAPDKSIGVGIIRQLYGVVQEEKATGGIIATTSFFTKGAKEFQEKVRYQVSLRDFLGVQKWLHDALCRNEEKPN